MKKKIFCITLSLLLGVLACGESTFGNVQAADAAPNVSPLESGLVVHYKFKQGDLDRTKKLHDYSGLNNYGLVDGPTWNPKGGKSGQGGFDFDGINDRIVIKDDPRLSPASTGQYAVSLWVRFDALQFDGEGLNKDWMDFIGKKAPDNYEWSLRLYNKDNVEKRPNRISAYQFNLDGGFGAGTYVQEQMKAGQWVHLVAVYNGKTVQLWKNGELKREDPITNYKVKDTLVNIIPKKGSADVQIGTTNNKQYMKGSFDDLRIYSKVLTKEEIKSLKNAN